jgi:ParB family chromosome partitioning protein
MSEVITTAPDFDAMSDEELVCWVRSNGTDTVSNWTAKIDKRYSGAIRREGDRMRAAMLYSPEGHRNRYRVFDVSDDECGIRVLPGRRPLNEDTIAQLVASIDRCGLLNPPAVRMVDRMVVNGTDEYNVPVLVYGHHRIEAMRRLGWSWVTCLVLDLDDVDAELSEIAENLHRAELTVLQRDEQVARWIELTAVKEDLPDSESKPVQPAQVSGGRGNKGGLSDAARELGIERTDAHRAIKVAALSPEAKAAAVETGLDDNRSALLEAAKEKEPEKQVEVLKDLHHAKQTKGEREQDKAECIRLYKNVLDAERAAEAPASTDVAPAPDIGIDEDKHIGQANLRNSLLMDIAAAIQAATCRYQGPIDDELVATCGKVASAWLDLADDLRSRLATETQSALAA